MIGVITNPGAGKNAGNPTRLARLRQILGHELEAKWLKADLLMAGGSTKS